MKLTGWVLIVLSGGGWIFLVGQWLYRWITDYYFDPEQWAALAWIGVFGAIAIIPIGAGVFMVYRAGRQDFPPIKGE